MIYPNQLINPSVIPSIANEKIDKSTNHSIKWLDPIPRGFFDRSRRSEKIRIRVLQLRLQKFRRRRDR